MKCDPPPLRNDHTDELYWPVPGPWDLGRPGRVILEEDGTIYLIGIPNPLRNHQMALDTAQAIVYAVNYQTAKDPS